MFAGPLRRQRHLPRTWPLQWVCPLPKPSLNRCPGVHELEKAGVRAAFMNAVVAATERAVQLAKSEQ